MVIFNKYIMNIIICSIAITVNEMVSYIWQPNHRLLSLVLGLYMLCVSLKVLLKYKKTN